MGGVECPQPKKATTNAVALSAEIPSCCYPSLLLPYSPSIPSSRPLAGECRGSLRSFFSPPRKLCLVRFTPPGPGGCHHRLECVLNNDPSSTQQVDLFGQGAWPAIEATCGGWDEAAAASGRDDGSSSTSLATLTQDERSVVYMRPTCVGIVSSGVIKVRACANRTGGAREVDTSPEETRFGRGQHTRLVFSRLFCSRTRELLVLSPRKDEYEVKVNLPCPDTGCVRVRSIPSCLGGNDEDLWRRFKWPIVSLFRLFVHVLFPFLPQTIVRDTF